MVDENLAKNIAYFILGISFVVMTWFILRQANQNRKSTLDFHVPKIAGKDVISGGAKNPQQFEEPDDDALDEMAELLGDED
tara:strand:+ start:217 stop:459 length:243 start_codon:yes stop_codon:yes gene_type:complete